MRATVTQYVRGVLDVRGDIAGIRVVAANKSFLERSELQLRVSALVPPDDEGLAYLGLVSGRLLFCRFEPYDGVGGRYTQIRGMAVSGVSDASFSLRYLAELLPRKEFYTSVRELEDLTFELPEGVPRWGTNSLQDKWGDQISYLLAGFVAGNRIILETNARRGGEAAGRLYDVWSLLPPTLRNRVTFASCREASGRPGAPQVQLSTTRYAPDTDSLWVPSAGVPPAAVEFARALIGLLRDGVDLTDFHREIEQALRSTYDASPENMLTTAAAIVDEWQNWNALERSQFDQSQLRAYLDKGEESRVARIAGAISGGDVALGRAILGGLAPESMEAVGAALVRRRSFSDELVVKLEAAIEGLTVQTSSVWRGLVGQIVRAGAGAKVVTIERLWRLLGPEPPVPLEVLFSHFIHDCQEAIEDHGWWRWLNDTNVGESSKDFRTHLPRCQLPLRWAYLLALGELTAEEQARLRAEASSVSSADAVAGFMEQWLEEKQPIQAARLQPLVPLFIAALRKSQDGHPHLARTVAERFSNSLQGDDLKMILRHLEAAGDQSTKLTVQFCDARQLAMEALQGLQAVRATKDLEAAARLVPRDPALLPFLTLLAIAGNDLSPVLLEVLGAAQADLRERLDGAAVERLAARIHFQSAEQALGYAWLVEWLTQRSGAAAEVLSNPSLEPERARLLELLDGLADKLADKSSSTDHRAERRGGKGRSLLGWAMGDP